ncbi:hypothetical protein [Candidatus Odyssella thessalonicensis]|uniref:hypothetical protein n=1 Tax=Candidatus Odyssella thessalonicensis TaxID=84647 RepID=UPI000225C1B5|nr:hypothetical protein [Candidatus Odyssella thessalonicensis]
MKNYFKKSLVLGCILSSSVFSLGAMEKDTTLASDSLDQEMQSLRDIREEWESFPCEKYRVFGDKILKLLDQSPQVDKEEVALIKQQFDLLEEVYLYDINWMSVQAAMALTPPHKRENPTSDLTGGIPKVIRQLNKIVDGKELWKHDMNKVTEECGEIDNLLNLNEYMYLMPYIDFQTGESAFSKQDFLKGFAGIKKDRYPISHQIYLYSLSAAKGAVHGGIYQTPIEILLHDWAHFRNLVGGGDESPILVRLRRGETLKFYGEVVQDILGAAKAASFNESETKKVITLLFYALHEVLEPIEDRAKHYVYGGTGNRSIRAMRNFLNDCQRHIEDYNSTFSLYHLQKQQKNDLEQYKKLKTFYRDVAWDLINDQFLTKEQVLAPGAKVLGTTYQMEPIHTVLLEMITWMRQELEKGGRLYDAMMSAKAL